MKTFFQTVIICLLICGAYWGYTVFKGTSYEPVIIANNTPLSESGGADGEMSTAGSEKKAEKEPETIEMKPVKICLVTSDGTMKFVERKTDKKTMKSIIELLLEGPTEGEKQKGLYSEIPKDVKVIWVREEGGNLVINLSENFALGGGSSSIMNRIGQLVKTVKMQGTKKPVYLYLGGKKAEYIGGEGVYLEQPLN